MSKQKTFQAMALSLVLVSGAADAGLFSKKKPAPPPPPPEPVVVVPVEPPTPPAPIPLEFSGSKTAPPTQASLDRLLSASPEVQATAQWIASSKDNRKLPFIIVDKMNAQVYSFTPWAQLKATAPILLGAGVGDKVLVSPDAPMSAIPPQKRITPAGRYVSKLAIDPHAKKTILSIDPVNLISLHIVAPGTPAQRRAERLLSVTNTDNRVSFGCINVPPAFFTDVVDPDFRAAQGIVYILPETSTAAQLFGFQPTVSGAAGMQVALKADESFAPGSAAAIQAAVQSGGSLAPVSAAPVSAAPVSAAPVSTVPASAAPVLVNLQADAPTQVPQATPAAATADATIVPPPVAQ
jgi:hypothetical protein